MKKFSNITFIDLFAGIGGFRQILEHYGAKCVFSSEIDKYACQTYEANYKEIPYGDITKIKNEDIPSHSILCAGFPCQPFSISGKQKGFDDARGTLFFEIARIAEYHKPMILFLENVANLTRHNDKDTFNTMTKILDDIGYDVHTQVLNASDYGVPQSRKRVYFACFRKDIGVKSFSFPAPSKERKYLKDILLPDDQTDKYVINRPDIVLRDIEITKCEANPIRIGTINKGGQGDRIYSPLGHAITLSAEGGGSGAKTGAYLINGRVRKLAPRECCRAQGFPESFIIPVSESQAYKQFGNSVAVPVLKAIMGKIVELKELNQFVIDISEPIENSGHHEAAVDLDNKIQNS